MSPDNTGRTARSLVEDVIGPDMTREIWTGNYDKVLPLSVQDFELSAVLPAVFYMFRFGYRRGKGSFSKKFGSDSKIVEGSKRKATVHSVASILAESSQFEGFQSEVGQAILGDLLLCFCLENAKRSLGRGEQVQRVAPAHYMSSWVDLPDSVAHLRFVPEMIVAMLADQKGEFIEQNRQGEKTWFAVGTGFQDNVLLRAFNQGISLDDKLAKLSSKAADSFDEEASVGLDQLLMIRLAKQLGAAPQKLRGGEGPNISNQRPIAQKAAREFSEDIRRFVRCFAEIIPRHAFVELLESCMAVGMTTILTSVMEILFEWADKGHIREKNKQKPAYLFIDCSNGVHTSLRTLAEQSLSDFMRRMARFPVILMALRLLDRGARYDNKIKALNISTKPDATKWLNILGELLHERREEAKLILYDLERRTQELAEKLEEDYSDLAQMMRNNASHPSPVWRLAEALISIRERRNTQDDLIKLFDSVILVDRPNGLALKKKITRIGKRTEVRWLVFTDPVLDYLVHLHVLNTGKSLSLRPLSLNEFIRKIHDRYGFCVDVAPPGMTISNEELQANRAILERRLRDLGLLVGVNDAETMKRLRPRFEPTTEDENGMD